MDIVTQYQQPINHYIPQNYAPVEKEYVEPRADDYFIYWLFRYRCVECKMAAQEINEIVPRARSKKSILNWKNRVPLCRACHIAYHDKGVTEAKIFKMRVNRIEYLQAIGRADYV